MIITVSLLQQLRYSMKFQELCFLLRKKYSLGRRKPLECFWDERFYHYIKWGGEPQAKSCIEYDLLRTCKVCDLEDTIDTYVLIYVCAQYGVTCTTKWLLNNKQELEKQHNLELDAKDTLIKYLYNKLIEQNIRIDTYVSVCIENLYQGEKGIYLEKPQQRDEIDKFKWFLDQELPSQLANIVNSTETHHKLIKDKTLRNRELRRNFLFWKWQQNGMKLKEIARKWDIINQELIEVTNKDIVSKGIKVYKENSAPLEDEPFCLYKNYLDYFDHNVSAEKTLEFIFRKLNMAEVKL